MHWRTLRQDELGRALMATTACASAKISHRCPEFAVPIGVRRLCFQSFGCLNKRA